DERAGRAFARDRRLPHASPALTDMDTILPCTDALFEQAACGLLLTDADGLILRANATVRRLARL
ncbi:hypothetical protein, partial [Massilia sp. WF1]|uniref:hypothetical protein n=1 Tax=Massilia sp. WF1 TaxID=1406431 RepID=UPI001E5DA706